MMHFLTSRAGLAATAAMLVLIMFATRATGAGEPARASDAGLAEWAKVHQVLSHPRCVNCHVGSDHVPMWSGDGRRPMPHGMNVKAGASRMGAEVGLTCGACHGHHNSEQANTPPGAHVWLLAPVSMEWFGKSSAQICQQIRDPTRNGGRTLEQVAEHIEKDALVAWGWNPGPGRERAPSSVAATAAALRAWARAGAPCPRD